VSRVPPAAAVCEGSPPPGACPGRVPAATLRVAACGGGILRYEQKYHPLLRPRRRRYSAGKPGRTRGPAAGAAFVPLRPGRRRPRWR